jgi:hypothetical protein
MQPRTLTQTKAGLLAAMCFSSILCASGQTLIHRYSFSDTAGGSTFVDSVGTANGTLDNSSAVNPNSASLDGSQLQLDGTGGYAFLPSGMISGNTQVTIEFWASVSGANQFWSRVFSFGDQNSGAENTGLDYCPYAGGNYQNLNLQTPSGNPYANNPGGLNGLTNVHVTVVVDPTHNTMYYYNGIAVLSTLNRPPVPALSTINDVYGLIGRSLYDVDPTMTGSVDEFRIYSGVIPLSQLALDDASGPNNIVTSPGTLEAVHLTAPSATMFLNGTLQLAFTGDFVNVSNLNLIAYGGAGFSSGNTNVLTVNPTNGSVHAVGVGSTTVTASYSSLNTNVTITVISVPTTLNHRYSFTADASDSVGGANGTLNGNATISGGQVVLDGSGGTYVSFPGSQINVATNSAITVETWATYGGGATWSRLWEFGSGVDNNSNIFCAPQVPNGGIFTAWPVSENIGSGSRTITIGLGPLTSVTLHTTAVLNPATSTLSVYTNGVLEYANYTATALLANCSTGLVSLGFSSAGDSPWTGSVNEFRIYNGALSGPEIALTDANGPGSTNRDPGALLSIQVQPQTCAAYSGEVPPMVLANYANLSGFNLLPNLTASVLGLTLSSDNTNVLVVLPNNMIRPVSPGQATLTASYQGANSSAVIKVKNVGTLAHRYSFTTDASDSVGGANGTLNGGATITSGAVQLDTATTTYVDLPPGLIHNYNAVTVEAWATFNNTPNWARLWFFGDNRANEYYFAPVVDGGSDNRYSGGFPMDGITFDFPPPLPTNSVHITCILGNGSFEIWTNGVLQAQNQTYLGNIGQVGVTYSRIGWSPYNDPGCASSLDEFRIYNGRLAPQEIQASDVLGPNQTLNTSSPTLKARPGVGTLTLSWPLANAGFSVQSSINLASGNWTTLTNVPTMVGNTNWQVTIPETGNAQFLRLWR